MTVEIAPAFASTRRTAWLSESTVSTSPGAAKRTKVAGGWLCLKTPEIKRPHGLHGLKRLNVINAAPTRKGLRAGRNSEFAGSGNRPGWDSARSEVLRQSPGGFVRRFLGSSGILHLDGPAGP